MASENLAKEIYINSHITAVIRERLEYCLRSARRKSPTGLIIEGPTGVGKTTTIENEQMRINQRYIDDGMLPPVYIVKSITKPGTKQYYSQILKSLGCHNPYEGTTQNLENRLYTQLKNKQVKVLIFDEFQQLVEKRGIQAVRGTLDDIKKIADEFHISCVFVGTNGVARIAEMNEQATSRYPYLISCNYMRFDTKKRQIITRKFMSAFFRAHKLTGLDMNEYESALRMYAATNGDLRLFVNLLDDVSGFLTAPETIKPVSVKALARAYGMLVRNVRLIKTNPFTADVETIEQMLKVKNFVEAQEFSC